MDCPPSHGSSTIRIEGLPHLDEIQGIVFCAVVEPTDHLCKPYADFSMRWCQIYRSRSVSCLKSKNVWYEYFVRESFELKGDSLQANLYLGSDEELFIGSVGVHIIYKHAENAKDHPHVNVFFFYY